MGSGIRLGKEMVFSGGVAENSGERRALEEVSITEYIIPVEPQITGALGAALIAHDEVRESGG